VLTEEEILVSTFTSHIKGQLVDAPLVGEKKIAQLLLEGVARGRQTWPDVQLSAEVFVTYLASVVGRHEGDIVRHLERVHVPDLYLVCGCLTRAPGAIPAFDKAFLSGIDRWLNGIYKTGLPDEVRQILREKLFVGNGATCAKLATYSGRGRLANRGGCRCAQNRLESGTAGRYASPSEPN